MICHLEYGLGLTLCVFFVIHLLVKNYLILKQMCGLYLSYHLQISPWINDLRKSTNEHFELFSVNQLKIWRQLKDLCSLTPDAADGHGDKNNMAGLQSTTLNNIIFSYGNQENYVICLVEMHLFSIQPQTT